MELMSQGRISQGVNKETTDKKGGVFPRLLRKNVIDFPDFKRNIAFYMNN